MSPGRRLRGSPRRSSSSLAATIRQSVCAITIRRSTPSRYLATTSVARTSSVTRPPALRMIFASPGLSPSIASGSIRESIQVSTARPRAARPSRSARREVAARIRVRRQYVRELVALGHGTIVPNLVEPCGRLQRLMAAGNGSKSAARRRPKRAHRQSGGNPDA